MNLERKPLMGTGATTSAVSDDILDRFDMTTAADEFEPLPRGVYTCLATNGKQSTAKTGTLCYEAEFRVTDGEHAGRRLWKRWYFTGAALPYTKRDLVKLGIDSRSKLDAPIPKNRLLKLMVVIRKGDDEIERNEVKSVDFIRIQEPEVNPFALDDEGGVQ